MVSAFVTAIAALAAATTAVQGERLFVLPQRPLVAGRIDPIVNPGGVAGHVHNIFGASNIRSELNTFDEMQRASCTTAQVQADKSNYWAPMLYFINEDNKFETMVSGARVYYFSATPGAQPFPKGMRIITGNAMHRDPLSEKAQGISIDCDEIQSGMYLPNATTHPKCNGLHVNIMFPSCGWANQSLDSWDHFSHLTWPITSGGGITSQLTYGTSCPPTHPIKYPRMFFQTNYYFNERQKSQWGKAKNGNSVVFSNGDTVGTSHHADFVSGWEPEVLAQAMTCGGTMEECSALMATYDNDKARTCRHQGMIPAEDIGYVKALDKLPGCNPLWTADMGPDKPNDCPDAVTPGWTAPNAFWNERGRGNGMPIAYDFGEGIEGEAIRSVVPNSGDKPYLLPAGAEGNDYTNQHFNKDTMAVGTTADVRANARMDTAVNKVDTVKGMVDSTPFSGMQPDTIVGEDKWKVWPNLGDWTTKYIWAMGEYNNGQGTMRHPGSLAPPIPPLTPGAAEATPTSSVASSATGEPELTAPEVGNLNAAPPTATGNSATAAGGSATPAASPTAAPVDPSVPPVVDDVVKAPDTGAEPDSTNATIPDAETPVVPPTNATVPDASAAVNGSASAAESTAAPVETPVTSPSTSGTKKCKRSRRRSAPAPKRAFVVPNEPIQPHSMKRHHKARRSRMH